MSWIVVMDQYVYCVKPTLEQARLLEASHMQPRTVAVVELLASWEPVDLSLPLVLHGTHKLIVV